MSDDSYWYTYLVSVDGEYGEMIVTDSIVTLKDNAPNTNSLMRERERNSLLRSITHWVRYVLSYRTLDEMTIDRSLSLSLSLTHTHNDVLTHTNSLSLSQ